MLNSVNDRPGKRVWGKLSANNITLYTQAVRINLDRVRIPVDAVLCGGSCSCRSHNADIDRYYESIVHAMVSASEPLNSPRSACPYVEPGWDDIVSSAHESAREPFLYWGSVCSPNSGLFSKL